MATACGQHFTSYDGTSTGDSCWPVCVWHRQANGRKRVKIIERQNVMEKRSTSTTRQRQQQWLRNAERKRKKNSLDFHRLSLFGCFFPPSKLIQFRLSSNGKLFLLFLLLPLLVFFFQISRTFSEFLDEQRGAIRKSVAFFPLITQRLISSVLRRLSYVMRLREQMCSSQKWALDKSWSRWVFTFCFSYSASNLILKTTSV